MFRNFLSLELRESVHAVHIRQCTCRLQQQQHPKPQAPFTQPKLQQRVAIVKAVKQDDRQANKEPKQQPDRGNLQNSVSSTPAWVQQLQRRWEGLDDLQKAYTLGVGLVVLAVLPRVLTLIVLGLERILIGGLLALEEGLLALLFKGGALVGVIGAVGLLLAGIYLFLVPRSTK